MAIGGYIPSSRVIQPGVCSSTTRPASPYEGQVIYETDTDKVLVWNGSAWYPNWNLPWGVVGYVKRTAGSYTTTNTLADVTGMTTTFTAVANRAYKVQYATSVEKITNAGTVNFSITDSANTGLYDWPIVLALSAILPICWTGIITGLSAGSQTIKVRASYSTAGAYVYATSAYPSSLIVEDIGPA